MKLGPEILEFEKKNVLDLKLKSIIFLKTRLNPPPKKLSNKFYNVKTRIKCHDDKEQLHNIEKNRQKIVGF
jgi:hypothetical protein